MVVDRGKKWLRQKKLDLLLQKTTSQLDLQQQRQKKKTPTARAPLSFRVLCSCHFSSKSLARGLQISPLQSHHNKRLRKQLIKQARAMSPPILSTPRSNANSADGAGSGALKKPVGKLTRYTIFVCVAAACGGLTFGYDIGVSGGVTSNRDFLKMVKRWTEGEALELPEEEHCWRRGRKTRRKEVEER